MTEKPEDTQGTLEEILRHIMQSAEGSDLHPIFIGMKIVLPPGGDFPRPPQHTRGDATGPAIEVHHVGDRVVLVTEMPGMAAGDIHVMFRDDRVFIWARDRDRHYTGSARVPPARDGSEEISFQNGVLEVSYLPVGEEDPKSPPNPG